jgi:exodeoxyribonuclease V alpha subunit
MLRYATTIHKSQGSQHPAVVIPIMTQHYRMLERNLLYTGASHAVKSWWFLWVRRKPWG